MKILDWLNSNAGLLSLLATLTAIIVPCIIYRKQRRDENQAIKDELDVMNKVNQFSMSSDERELFTRKFFLEKRLKRK
ncbi:MAG: hypothetical protein K2L45_12425 [Muribaculaceae bacterium]|nr:hypothetical protein [Muribaculaceae bacterium]